MVLSLVRSDAIYPGAPYERVCAPMELLLMLVNANIPVVGATSSTVPAEDASRPMSSGEWDYQRVCDHRMLGQCCTSS